MHGDGVAGAGGCSGDSRGAGVGASLKEAEGEDRQKGQGGPAGHAQATKHYKEPPFAHGISLPWRPAQVFS